MGCDIHAEIEYEEYGPGNGWFVFADLHFPRHYMTFSAMAGVRGDLTPVVEPRGLPEHCFYREGESEIGDHSFSWLTADEFEAALDLSDAQPLWHVPKEYRIALKILRELPGSRLVFGFDS